MTCIRGATGFNTYFAENDDYWVLANIGFSINFNGNTYTQCWVNNNGNISFENESYAYTSGIGTFTPPESIANYVSSASAYPETFGPMFAVFWADVDTRDFGGQVPPSELATYGNDTIDGHLSFGCNWLGVEFYSTNTTRPSTRNYFQLIIIQREDIGVGAFDLEYNYGSIVWDIGNASGGNYTGRAASPELYNYSSAVVGYLYGKDGNGTLNGGFWEDGSSDADSFIDGGTYSLQAIGRITYSFPSLTRTVGCGVGGPNRYIPVYQQGGNKYIPVYQSGGEKFIPVYASD